MYPLVDSLNIDFCRSLPLASPLTDHIDSYHRREEARLLRITDTQTYFPVGRPATLSISWQRGGMRILDTP